MELDDPGRRAWKCTSWKHSSAYDILSWAIFCEMQAKKVPQLYWPLNIDRAVKILDDRPELFDWDRGA